MSVSGVALSEFGLEVREGLTKVIQKELPSRYFYDDLGSTLFEAITLLPEYGLTRADERLLRLHAAELADRVPAPAALIELGSGTGHKTRYVLEAFRTKQPDELRYFPIDVSSAALERCCVELGAWASVHPLTGAYLEGMSKAVQARRPGESLLVLFLGSTLGNFDRLPADRFLKDLRSHLLPGDGLLLGTDLLKPRDEMLLAYDDPTGVTAAFNLNLLGRINRELHSDFDLRQWAHEALWNDKEQRIEMHLRARTAQTVSIPGADATIRFSAGESIWTESSHKFDLPELALMAERSGFRPEQAWVDDEWPFAENLWTAI